MREILVIRFGALGDLCVLGWSLAARAGGAGGTGESPARDRVTVATKAAFAPLVERMRGVDEVVVLGDGGLPAVRDLAARLATRRWDLVLDAHNILRSHLLCGLLGRRPDTRLAKDTAARLAFMTFGQRSSRLDLRMRDRFDAVLAPAGVRAPDSLATPPLADAFPPRRGGRRLGLAPGARWDTKRWPEASFAEVARAHRRAGDPVRIFLGPREEAWFDGDPQDAGSQASSPLGALAAEDPAVEVVRGADLTTVAAALAEVDVLLTNDSGLLHVAEGVGTPVVALFGPTVREFGYFPLLPASRVLETALDCRPCSRNGKRPCHRGDLACLRRLEPAAASAAVEAVLSGEVVA